MKIQLYIISWGKSTENAWPNWRHRDFGNFSRFLFRGKSIYRFTKNTSRIN